MQALWKPFAGVSTYLRDNKQVRAAQPCKYNMFAKSGVAIMPSKRRIEGDHWAFRTGGPAITRQYL
jgi:hypothetical protein